MNNSAAYSDGLTGDLIQTWVAVFQRQKAFAEHAFDQLDDKGFFRVPAEGLNSVAVIAQHMAGNMLSRWTDFLTTDGEKPTRDRESEFGPPNPSADGRRALMERWESGWEALFGAIKPLTQDDLQRTTTIRGAPHTVNAAVVRQIDHYGFHVGQINVIARLYVGTAKWRWFTVAPGESEAFNKQVGQLHGWRVDTK